MKKNIFIMALAFVLVMGMSSFAFARHYGHKNGVKHGYYKVKKHKHHKKPNLLKIAFAFHP